MHHKQIRHIHCIFHGHRCYKIGILVLGRAFRSLYVVHQGNFGHVLESNLIQILNDNDRIDLLHCCGTNCILLGWEQDSVHS
jgi:hypothetical protein